ncbi:MAG: ABC transporter ATP-binding protein [Brevinema sp.]
MKNKQVTSPIRRLLRMLSIYKGRLLTILMAAILFVAGRTGVSYFIGDFINNVFMSGNTSSLNIRMIGLLFGLGFLWSAAQYMMYVLSGKLAIRIAHLLREKLYEKLVRLPIPYYHKHDSSRIISTASNDITLVESFLMNIMVQLVAQPLTVLAIIATMFIINWKLSLYFIILGPLIAGLLGIVGSKVQKLGRSMQENIAGITKIFSESIRHIVVIKGYNSEDAEISRFKEKNQAQLTLADKEVKIRLLGLPASDFLGITAVILLLSVGALGIQLGIAVPGDVAKFVAMAIVLSEPISSSSQLILVVRRLAPSLERIFEILDTPEEQENLKPIEDIKGQLSFKDVHFSYNHQRKILNNVSLDIKSGETIAILGASGSGKSTFMALIPKFYCPQQGQILIDGKNISEYDAASIRHQIALVTQDTALFSDTILSNITLSKPDATLEEIEEAARIAHADAFINALPDKYLTQAGDQGSRLSGGERQRIILARAVLRKPAFLLLDEPTSALDAASEKQVSQALENIYGRQTTIIIAHKLKTIEKVDRIAIMHDGKIAEFGTHQELLEKGGLYTKLRGVHG